MFSHWYLHLLWASFQLLSQWYLHYWEMFLWWFSHWYLYFFRGLCSYYCPNDMSISGERHKIFPVLPPFKGTVPMIFSLIAPFVGHVPLIFRPLISPLNMLPSPWLPPRNVPRYLISCAWGSHSGSSCTEIAHLQGFLQLLLDGDMTWNFHVISNYQQLSAIVLYPYYHTSICLDELDSMEIW